jgi:hypothetical protein
MATLAHTSGFFLGSAAAGAAILESALEQSSALRTQKPTEVQKLKMFRSLFLSFSFFVFRYPRKEPRAKML